LESEKLEERMVHRIRLRLSNAYILTGERVVLVDTGGPGEELKISQALGRLGYHPEQVSLILHTHGHSDHAGSTQALQKRWSVPAAVHQADLEMVRQGRNRTLNPTRWTARLIRGMVDAPFPAFEPEVVFEEEFDLAPYGVVGKVVMAPGHTAGSILVDLEEGNVIAGDLLMGGSLGGQFFPRVPRLHYFAEDCQALASSLAKLARLQAQSVYVGHGGPLDGAAVRRFISRYAAAQPQPSA
jgi:glyoxylase-like metal-dependent hydrolase (beta-lactamase superfamily II)